MAESSWDQLTGVLRELEAFEGALGVLAWDQQTMMPRKASAARGAQIAALSTVVHERFTDARIERWLADLEGQELDRTRAAAVRNTRRAYDRATKLPPDLVGRMAEAQTEAFEAWMRAKQASDFSKFAPSLERLLDLTREKTQALDPARHPYDVLLDDYDPGTTVDSLRSMFSRLRDGISTLLAAIAERPQFEAFDEPFDVDGQRRLHLDVLTALGYDLGAGRLDDAEHPFTIGIHPTDVRVTTHLYDNDLLSGLGGTVHEAGHGLYEQGLPIERRGMMVAKAASYGLHESQSRFWENTIGRSLAFSRFVASRVPTHFPGRVASADAIYRAQNRVQPGLIRIKADEVTYNLHIIVRFEIELALFEGRLAVKDLPEAWNARYREYLGVTPPDDAHGVLQDVHWSGAAFAYFPSYTLGNLYAAALGVALERANPDLWAQVERGEFGPTLGWLRDNVHAHGHVDEAPERIRAVCGDVDLVEALLGYLWGRHGALYGVTR